MGKKINTLLLASTLCLGASSLGAIVKNHMDLQQDNPRIALDRRGVYKPIVNDILCQGISPFSYNTEAKLKELIPNLISGREKKHSPREDAWALYLGKTQKNNAFSVSNYSLNNSGETSYAINGFFDNFFAYYDVEDIIEWLSEKGPSTRMDDFDVMRAYTMGVSKDEDGRSFVYYYDIWDLDVPLERDGGFFGKPYVIYDRLYFDSETYELERPLEEVVVLDTM